MGLGNPRGETWPPRSLVPYHAQVRHYMLLPRPGVLTVNVKGTYARDVASNLCPRRQPGSSALSFGRIHDWEEVFP